MPARGDGDVATTLEAHKRVLLLNAWRETLGNAPCHHVHMDSRDGIFRTLPWLAYKIVLTFPRKVTAAEGVATAVKGSTGLNRKSGPRFSTEAQLKLCMGFFSRSGFLKTMLSLFIGGSVRP
jgi:hypothetical protein